MLELALDKCAIDSSDGTIDRLCFQAARGLERGERGRRAKTKKQKATRNIQNSSLKDSSSVACDGRVM